jgi:dual specificity phosphatase 12
VDAFGDAHAHEVLPGLWLGDQTAAADGDFLATNRIRAVFNCTRHLPFHDAVPGDKRHRVAIEDALPPTGADREAEQRAMAALAVRTVARICHEMRGGAVLVHCVAGRQRSASVVAMLLMFLHAGRLDAAGAIGAVRAKRPPAFVPQPTFFPTLAWWQEQCGCGAQ